MDEIQNKNLLRNKEVLGEIGRHQWIESEKAGHDIGFEKASTDWLIKFSKAWMSYHLPKQKSAEIRKSEETENKNSSLKRKAQSKASSKKR